MTQQVPNGAVIEPVNTKKTEPKVIAGTAVATLVSIVLTVVGSLVSNTDIVAGLPDWVIVIVTALITFGSTLLAGRTAPHQYRIPEAPKAAARQAEGDW